MNTVGRRRRFIWIKGVLGWGLLVGSCHATLMAYFQREQAGFFHALLLWLCFMPLWAVAGYIWGAVMWRIMANKNN